MVRGDVETITVGARANVQDNVTLHADPGFPVTIGERVSIGHNAVVHGATVEDDCLIGMGATVLNGAVIGADRWLRRRRWCRRGWWCRGVAGGGVPRRCGASSLPKSRRGHPQRHVVRGPGSGAQGCASLGRWATNGGEWLVARFPRPEGAVTRRR
ncbi:hypothetical protein GPN2_13039 [Streptomyces murinus]